MMILLGIGIFISGVMLGMYMLYRLVLKAYTSDPTGFIKSLERSVSCDDIAETDELVEVIEVEKYESKFILSFKRNGAFVSQGDSFAEAIRNAHERYPNVHFRCDYEEYLYE